MTLAQLDSTVEEEVLEALLRLGDVKSDSRKATKHTDSNTRALLRVSRDSKHLAVTRSLAILRASQASQDFKSIVTDANQDIVVRSVASLVLLGGSRKDYTWLTSILENRSHPLSVRWAILVAMNILSDTEHDGSVLVRLAQDPGQEPVIRRLALAALRHFRHNLPPDTMDALIAALRSGDDELALAAAEASLRINLKGASENQYTEVLSILDNIAFNETRPQELREMALASLAGVDIDGIAGLRERAIHLFHNQNAATPLRHAAAKVALQSDITDDTRTATHLRLLCDKNTPQLLRESALDFLTKSEPTSEGSIAAIRVALPDIGPMLAKHEGTIEHRTQLVKFLHSLAQKGHLRSELRQLHVALTSSAREPFSELDPELKLKRSAINLLLISADTSQEVAKFLELMAMDSTVEAPLREAVISGLSRTAQSSLSGAMLIRLIQDKSSPIDIRLAASDAIGRLGTGARPFAQALLPLTEKGQQLSLRARLLDAMVRIRVDSETLTISAANLLLHNEAPISSSGNYWHLHEADYETAAQVLSRQRSNAGSILPQLLLALEDSRFAEKHRTLIARTIASIATGMADEGRVVAIPQLRTAVQIMEKLAITEPQAEVRRAIRALENEWLRNLLYQVGPFLADHLALSAGLIYTTLALLAGVLLLYASPLSIHRLNVWAEKIPEHTLPPLFGGLTLSLRPLLIVTVFRYHSRVMNAWVEQALPTVREEFSKKKAVHLRQLYVPLPVELNGVVEHAIDPAKVRTVTSNKRFFLALEGEGGAGKSSLAFRLARWAMAEDPNERLAAFSMIPILLEHDLPNQDTDAPVLAAIQTELMSITRSPEPLSMAFIQVLLSRQRLLVVADRVSELSDYTQQQLMSVVPTLPISALILTSRREEVWQGTSKTVLRPVRISGNFVASFLDSYLVRRDSRVLFDDEEFFELCRGLSALARERDITPLLGKLYADYWLTRKRGTSTTPRSAPFTQPEEIGTSLSVDAPQSIPALICSYVDQISESVKSPYRQHEVHDLLQTVAWECVRASFHPGSASVKHLHSVLGSNAEKKLTFAVEKLGLVQMTGLSKDQVRFALDPLAEYLAAIAMIQKLGGKKAAWTPELDRLELILKERRGQAFAHALVDCCKAELGTALPTTVVARIDGLASRSTERGLLRGSG